ncbi:MAG: IPT/TIG domain-containing protein [Pseudomonadota bacterium]
MFIYRMIFKRARLLCLGTLIISAMLATVMAGCGGGGLSISGVTPSAGPPSGGTEITITGNYFAANSTVMVGSNAATDVVYVDDTTLTAKTPAGDEGAVNVSVIIPTYGQTASLTNGFTYRLPTLTVNVVDSNGDAVEGAFVMLGTDPSTEFQGTTDASGRISFSSEDLDDTQTITASKNGYRNYTIFDFQQPQTAAEASANKTYDYDSSETWEANIRLSPLQRPHGWINTSIDVTTWGDLADNCPGGPGTNPCVFRCAWINVPIDDMTASLNSTDCEACIGQSPIMIPGIFGVDTLMAPAFLDQTRVTAAAGLFDISNPGNMTATFSRFGITTFAIDSSNTAANPKDVSIPLTIDMGDEWAVTIDLTNAQPADDDRIAEMLLVNIPPYGIAAIGAMMGINLGGTEISEFAYRFPGLDPVAVAASQEMANASYATRGELSKADGTYTAYTNSATIMNDTQLMDIDYLLPAPHITTPVDGELLPGSDAMDVSWTEGGGTFDFTLTSVGSLYFDGNETENNFVWDILAPQGRTEFSLPTLPDDTLPGLETCQVYEVNVASLSLTGFAYNDGMFGNWIDLFASYLPVLESADAITVFTPGQDCGPLISAVDPTEGDPAGGEQVTIEGMFFGDTQGGSTVMFGANAGNVTAWSNTQITVQTPAGAAGTVVKLIVTVDGKASNDAYFSYNN